MLLPRGVSVPVQTSSSVSRANGTSFSCPVLSGMVACLMQSVPKATVSDIISSLHSSSDRYNFPDSLYGYGIPDMAKMISTLQEILVAKPENDLIIGPNPFTGDLTITFRNVPESLKIEVFNSSGSLLLKRNYKDYISRSLKITELEEMRQGLYFIRLTTTNGTLTQKVIKTSE